MADEKYQIDVPILIVGFNRPDIIQQNIDNLRQFSIQKLYVAIDGPRVGNDDDQRKVAEVRNIAKKIDFCPNVYFKFSEVNQGAEVTVSSAIGWVLEQEKYVIVLEDDVIAHRSFFQFMQEMLLRYEDDSRVAMVSGCNYTPMELPNGEDYCFCQSGHTSGGWATWNRVWKDYDLYEEIKEEYLKKEFLKSISANNTIAKKRKKIYESLKKNGKKNNWDVMFGYFRDTRHYLSIVPRSHLTSNIGVYGLHQKGANRTNFRKIDENFIAVNHPHEVVWNKKYDIYHYKHWVRTPLKKIVKSYWHGVMKRLKSIK